MGRKPAVPLLSLFEAGYAAEMLPFQCRSLWMIAEKDAAFREHLNGYLAPIEKSAAECAKCALPRTSQAAERVFEAASRALAEFEGQWQGDKHRRTIRIIEESESEGLTYEWERSVSPLDSPVWSTYFKACSSMSRAPNGLCFKLGQLLARVEGLDSPAQELVPGDRYPIHSLRDALRKLVMEMRSSGLVLDIKEELGRLEENYVSVAVAHQVVPGLLTKLRAALGTRWYRRRRLTVDQANQEVTSYLRKHPQATQREIARALACAHGTIGNTSAWKAFQAHSKAVAKPGTRKAVSLSPKVISRLGKEDDSQMNEGDDVLEQLIREHNDDYEPSPVESGPRGNRVRCRKKY